MDVLDHQQRRSRILLLEKRLDLYEEMRANRELEDDETETYVTDLRELAKLKRIDCSEADGEG